MTKLDFRYFLVFITLSFCGSSTESRASSWDQRKFADVANSGAVKSVTFELKPFDTWGGGNTNFVRGITEVDLQKGRAEGRLSHEEVTRARCLVDVGGAVGRFPSHLKGSDEIFRISPEGEYKVGSVKQSESYLSFLLLHTGAEPRRIYVGCSKGEPGKGEPVTLADMKEIFGGNASIQIHRESADTNVVGPTQSVPPEPAVDVQPRPASPSPEFGTGEGDL